MGSTEVIEEKVFCCFVDMVLSPNIFTNKDREVGLAPLFSCQNDSENALGYANLRILASNLFSSEAESSNLTWPDHFFF